MSQLLIPVSSPAAERSWQTASVCSSVATTSRSHRRRVLLVLALPLLGLVLFTIVFRITDLDITVSSFFYSGLPGSFARRWPGLNAQPWASMYRFGTIPGLSLGIAGAVIAAVTWRTHRRATWGRTGLFLALMLALGPGLLVNGVLKPYWNRPRPMQIREFGGPYEYVSVLDTVPCSAARSFPCGHASMGFYLAAPAFVLYRRRRKMAWAFALLGLGAGGILGWGRIVQGGHFVSDVIWSCAAVYVSGLFVYFLLGLHRPPGAPTLPSGASGT